MRSNPVYTSRGWQAMTSTPSFTRSATHASRRSGDTASAFITATLKPYRVRMSSIRPVMSRVPCGWRRPAPFSLRAVQRPRGRPGLSPWGRASPRRAAGPARWGCPSRGRRPSRSRAAVGVGEQRLQVSGEQPLGALANACARGMAQGVEDPVVRPPLGEARRVRLPVHGRQQHLLLVGRQAGGHVREPQEDGAADEGAMLAADRAA